MCSVSFTKDVEQYNLLLFNHAEPFHHNVLPFNSFGSHPRDSTLAVFCKSKVYLTHSIKVTFVVSSVNNEFIQILVVEFLSILKYYFINKKEHKSN